jgi:hypothetical protein
MKIKRNQFYWPKPTFKEIYIGRYMDQCSDYIGKLEVYRRKLNLMATRKNEWFGNCRQVKEFIEDERILH